MKKYISISFFFFSLIALSQDFVDNIGVNYIVTSSIAPFTVEIVDYTGTSTDIIIPSTIENLGITYNVTSIGAIAFRANDITTITIPDSVTSIGNNAFQYNNIDTLIISNSLESIGDYAFDDNSLTSLVIPNSVFSIGNNAFTNNFISNLIIPNSVISIGDYAFANNRLGSVIIPDSITSIADFTFFNNRLTSVTIPNSVTSIGDATFRGNYFVDLVIPDSITSIGATAFFDNRLTSVTISANVTSIGASAFRFNENLTSVTSLSSTPAILADDIFDDVSTINLMIPLNTETLYTTANWIGFESITIIDTTAPIITLIGENPQTIELGLGYLELGATVDDGSTLVIDQGNFQDIIGSYTITYNATDMANNVADEVTRTVNVVDNITLSSQEFKIDKIQIYPNPSSQDITITVPVVKVSFYDVSGVKVLEQNTPSFSVEKLVSGIYFVKVETKNGTSTKKIIKI